MTKERPYEELNTLTNPQVPHGNCYYLKGSSHTTPSEDLMAQVVGKAAEISNAGKFRSAFLFEYFSLEKVNSVPVSATAFRRDLSSNILMQLVWDGKYPERTGEARVVMKDMVDIVLKAQGMLNQGAQTAYTNYGHGKSTKVPALSGDANHTRLAFLDIEMPAESYAHPSGDHQATGSLAAFASNYPRLQELKKKYDPQNIFNRWYPITPAA
jgi:hypothetical protein